MYSKRSHGLVAVSFALVIPVALGSCNSPPRLSEARDTPTESAVAAVNTGIDLQSGHNCRVEADGASTTLCGTRKVPLEDVPAFSFSRQAALSFGEEAPAILGAVAVRRQVAEQVLNASPDKFSAALDAAEVELRGQLESVCIIEARRKRGRNSEVTRGLFELYAWITYRRALIDESGNSFANRWDEMLRKPCFATVGDSRNGLLRDFYFGKPPGFISVEGDSIYELPEYFSRSLSYYYHFRGNPVLADTLWYRADLDSSNESKVACLTGNKDNAASRNIMQTPKVALWSTCTKLTLSGKSCIATLEACGGPHVSPPWQI